MLVKQENLKLLNTHFDFGEPIYVNKKWESKLSDLLSQLFIVSKLKYSFIIHAVASSNNAYVLNKDNKKDYCVYFKQENKDVFLLTFKTSVQNELVKLDWKTFDKEKQLISKIPVTKTIKRLSFDFASGIGVRHFHSEVYWVNTIKSSVEFLEKLIKLI